MIGELDGYLSPHGGQQPPDYDSVNQTRRYLKACNLLFEQGFLSHKTIKAPNDQPMVNIENGYQFFVDWYSALEGPGFNPTNSLERRFISWQTWDLLRVCVYGFQSFCSDFLQRHPGYYITPMKWNGSAVETLFSQFKQIAGNKLDSTNYSTARKAFLTKRLVHGHKASAAVKGYRDTPLYARDMPLRKK